MNSSASSLSPAWFLGALLGLALGLPAAAQAQNADNPPRAQRAQTLKTPPPPRDGTVLGSAKRGADAAGRGVDRAEGATRRGVDNVSERASRAVRRAGESLGRKLPGGTRHPAPPPVGPQSTQMSPS
ncbi:hypothetical protein [Variovorax sp. UMC13]|uniref:hypothetical protein n=1 Tax=Variovorax sp. UMC13 TaxID=1862326 RepID=UPI0016030A6D|nr:hypothetical protein [Variovorax sp. UMC13]MBB1604120.1 hypothetical protein [Variovorax sp. UMC13]